MRDGDDYVINGQKIWTSYGHVADYCEMLVRTDFDVPKHKGITWLIVPMDRDGIDVRPLLTMEGSSEFCEVFLDDVRVPVANRVGDENDGWRVANVTLSFERGTAFVSDVLQTVLVRDLADLARKITSRGATKWEDAGLRRDLGKIAAELDALWALTKRNVSQAQRTGLVGPGGSAFKLAFTELRNRLGDLAMHLLDRASLCLDDIGDIRIDEQMPPVLGHLDDHRRGHVAGAAQHRRRAGARAPEGSVGRASGLRAHHRPGRPPGGDARVRRRPLPDGCRARDRRRRWPPRPREVAGARRDRRVLAAPPRGRRRPRPRRVGSRARVPGARPRARARASCCVASRAELIPEAATGEQIVGILEPSVPVTMVEFLGDLDVLLVLTDDGVRRIDPAALTTQNVDRPLDPLSPVKIVTGEVPEGELIAGPDVAQRWLMTGAVLTGGIQVGIAERTVELATEYAKEREQFGRAIGSFQAIKHLIADMFVKAAVARAGVESAACALDGRSDDDPVRAASAAKLMADEAARFCARTCIQVHGGIGFTWEVDVQRFWKRACVLDTHFGTVDEHAEVVASTL